LWVNDAGDKGWEWEYNHNIMFFEIERNAKCREQKWKNNSNISTFDYLRYEWMDA